MSVLEGYMFKSHKKQGFSLIEVLLVLAIIGIISGIAIPSYMGQRRRSRVIGDAMSNAKVIAMLLEQYKADNGTYGPGGATANWTPASNVPVLAGYAVNPCPTFTPAGNSRMNYTVAVGPTGLAYVLNVNDTTYAGVPLVFQTDQTGATLFRLY